MRYESAFWKPGWGAWDAGYGNGAVEIGNFLNNKERESVIKKLKEFGLCVHRGEKIVECSNLNQYSNNKINEIFKETRELTTTHKLCITRISGTQLGGMM